MPFLSHTKHPANDRLPTFSLSAPIPNNPGGFVPAGQDRQHYFAAPEHRKATTIDASDVFEVDFCQGFLSFDHGIALSFPIGLSFDLTRIWDGRPIVYACCERGKTGEGPGPTLWCVGFQIVQDKEEEDGEGEDDDEDGEEAAGAKPALKDNSDDID